MANVYVLKVTTDVNLLTTPAVMLWVVESKTPERAKKAVEPEIPRNCAVEMTEIELSSDTIRKLGLLEDKARSLVPPI